MAMAAHDLRTPLTVIAGFAATLREQWDAFGDDDRKQFLYRINANTKRLSEFVGDAVPTTDTAPAVAPVMRSWVYDRSE